MPSTEPPPAYLTAEFAPDSLGLFLFTGSEFAKRFATADGLDCHVRAAALTSAAQVTDPVGNSNCR